MSRSIDLFIDSPLEVAELAAELASLGGLQAEPATTTAGDDPDGEARTDAEDGDGYDDATPGADGDDPHAEPTGWWLADGHAAARLAEHGYVDDGTLRLARYRYVLSARVPSNGGLLDSPQAVMLRRLLEALTARTELSALLTFDLQYRLGEAGARHSAR